MRRNGWRCVRTLAGALLVTGGAVTGAHAQALDPISPAPRPASDGPSIQVTPFVSLGSEVAAQAGAAIGFGLRRNLGVELEVGYRPNLMLSSTANVLYHLPPMGRITPYVAGGVGIEQQRSLVDIPLYGAVPHWSTGLALNAGGGIMVPIQGRWGLRVDARWLNLAGNRPEGWRIYQGLTFGLRK